MYKVIFVFLSCIFCLQKTNAQNVPVNNYPPLNLNIPEDEQEDRIFTKCEFPPAYPGGDSAWKKYVFDNARLVDYLNCGAGTYNIIVSFIVNTKGMATDISIEDGTRPCGIEKEAIRLVKSVPKWKPGVQNGTLVKALIRIAVPISIY